MFTQKPVATAAPTGTVLRLDTIRNHLRISDVDQDDDLSALLATAIGYVEERTGRTLLTTIFDWTIPSFYREEMNIGDGVERIMLPNPPLVDLIQFKYYDATGTLQTKTSSWFNPLVDIDNDGDLNAIIRPKPGMTWPGTQVRDNAVLIQFRSGYGVAESDMPVTIKHLLKMLIGHWFDNREPVVVGTTAASLPLAIDALFNTVRTGRYPLST